MNSRAAWEQGLEGVVLGLGRARQVPVWIDRPPQTGSSPHTLSLLELSCIRGEQGRKYELLEIKFLLLKVKDFIRKINFSYSKKKRENYIFLHT